MTTARGTLRPLTADVPLVLDREDVFWMVEDGEVHVFVSAEAGGSRSLLFTAGRGEVLFGLDPAATGGVGLLAVGLSGAAVSELPMSAILPLADDVEKRRALVSAVERLSGSGNGPSALSPDAFPRVLAEVRGAFGERLRAVVRESQENDRRQLDQRVAVDSRAREASLRSLASLLETDAPPAAAVEAHDPLLMACRAIGGIIGIDFVDPPRGERPAHDALDAIARASRIRYRRVALRGAWWETDSGPLLCFRAPGGEPVAAVPISPGRYALYDPSQPSRLPIDASLAGTLRPFAMSFYRPLPPRSMGGIDLIRFTSFGTRFDMRRVALAAIAAGLLGLLVPIGTGYLMKEVIPNANRSELVALFVTLIVAAFAAALFDLARSFALLRFEATSEAALQGALIDRLISLPVPFFRRYSVGDLALRAMAVNQMREILGGTTMMSLIAGLTAFFNFVLLFVYSARLAVVATLIVLVTFIITVACNYAALRYDRKVQDLGGKVAGLVFQLLGGIAKLRVAGAEDRAFAVWAQQFREKKALAFRAMSMRNVVKTMNDALPVAASAALFCAVFSIDRSTRISTGDFIAFNTAFVLFLTSAVAMSGTALQAMNVVPLYERVKPILTAVPENDMTKPDCGVLSGSIEVNHVTFRYGEDAPPVLQDISFHAAPREFVALVGPSGSGKSTMLRLLLGFESPESGAVYYDDHDVSQIDIASVRRQIGVVLQSSRLMSGDIMTNIIGSTLLTIDDAWEAAEAAGLADDIRRMPMGMYTVISEGGSTISGGQRQRLLIARALIAKPRIIFFDEATSALDNRTQKIVSESLDRMNATRVVIAHRLSTIRNADRIYVLVNGAMEQTGTFDELNAVAGTFQSLVARQTLDRSTDADHTLSRHGGIPASGPQEQ